VVLERKKEGEGKAWGKHKKKTTSIQKDGPTWSQESSQKGQGTRGKVPARVQTIVNGEKTLSAQLEEKKGRSTESNEGKPAGEGASSYSAPQ